MDIALTAQGFSAMGSESRLNVLNTLVKAGKIGLQVGAIQSRTNIPPSTLAHHLKFLASANLIIQEKQGRAIICVANYTHLRSLAAYIMHECCAETDRKS